MYRVLLGVASLLISFTLNAADAAAGAASYALCASCHGAKGEGVVAMNGPKLAGQERWYLKNQLKAFRNGLRGGAAGDALGAQMRGMAATLVDEAAVDNVIAYIESFPQVDSPVTVQGDATKGKSLYGICGTCHGANGEGNTAMNGPRLAGQNDWYMVSQINNFKKGLRGAAPGDALGMQMRGMAMTLADDQAVLDVVSYINSLQ